MENMSLSDIAAVTRDNDGMFGGNGLIILILFFLFFGMNGWGGNGRGNGVATPDDVYFATNNQTIQTKLNEIGNGICSSSYENARLIDGVNMQSMNNTNSIIATVNADTYAVTSKIDDLSHHLDECCCNLRTQMLEDRLADTQAQLVQAQMAVTNAVQTQNILGNLGRFVTNPPCYGYPYYNYGTTTA